MSQFTRRQLLAGLLGGLVRVAGPVVLARSVLPVGASQDETKSLQAEPQRSLEERADQVAEGREPLDEEEGYQSVSFINGGFRNGAFRNGGGGGFRKGGFANGGGGGFRNGGFGNGGGGGGFRKGGFANGGGGGFRNGGFANGGGFRKGGFLN